jgi:hypothetical protein
LQIVFNRTELLAGGGSVLLEYQVDDANIASVMPSEVQLNYADLKELEESGNYPIFNVTGNFLGVTTVQVKRTDEKDNRTYISDSFDVTVLRVKSPLDKAFTYSVAALVGIIYINMGAALDTRIITETMKKPIGPAIGFFSQFVIMPLVGHL